MLLCHNLIYKYLEPKKNRHIKGRHSSWSKIAASVLLLTSATHLNATENQTNKPNHYQFQEDNSKRPTTPNKNIINDSIKNSIKGFLIEETSGIPIPSTKIKIEGTTIETETDSLGNFEIIIPENYSKKEVILHVIAGYGFEGETKRTILLSQLPITDLVIKEPDVLVGEVTVTTYRIRTKWWQFWRKKH